MGMAEPMGDSNTMYLYIIQGHLMQKVNQDAPGAVARKWESKSDGSSGTKYELQYKNLTGYLTGIEFKDSEFGEQCLVKMEANGEKAQLQLGLNSRYFASFAQRFKNINLDLLFTLNAYSFEKDGKDRTGISITQDGKKIKSYFWDDISKCSINGMPQPENKEEYDTDDWKYYFSKVKKFLKLHIETELSVMIIKDKPSAPSVAQQMTEISDPPPPDNQNDDLPF